MDVADKVALAIVTASRILGVDPIRVASGDKPNGSSEYGIPRARAYAAMGLRGVTGWDGMAIARMVGSKHPKVFMTLVRNEMSKAPWWDESVADRVKLALSPNAVANAVSSISEIKFDTGRPFATERQRRAYEELQRALANTVALQAKEGEQL